jgi:hypothetical protein
MGQRVEEGQEIGQCGNSGNTSEPHIHIHHQRQDPPVVPLNFAEGLPLFFRDHDGAAMPEGGIRDIDGTPVPTWDLPLSTRQVHSGIQHLPNIKFGRCYVFRDSSKSGSFNS